ncbi:uracil-DNA glycosylase-like protein [Syncephalis fuscata]|nr:uracil-DNA glycosylase-like protein [Syncephalis fuscata]
MTSDSPATQPKLPKSGGLITSFFTPATSNDNKAPAPDRNPLKRTTSERQDSDNDDKDIEQNKAETADDLAGTKRVRLDATSLTPEKRELLELELRTMSPEWQNALSNEFNKPYFIGLKRFLVAEKKQSKTILPPADQIYSWSRWTMPNEVKVVILGQDPYHNIGQAHGLCFSVTPTTKIPPSLINIYKAIKQDIPDFNIPSHGYLGGWARQGVLLLNASLTVRAHQAGSHANRGWETFTDAIVNYLNQHRKGLVFMLWGSHAQKKGKGVDKKRHLVLNTVHPSPLSAHRGETFFACKHFSKANKYLKEQGKPEIDWSRLPIDIKPNSSVDIKTGS